MANDFGRTDRAQARSEDRFAVPSDPGVNSYFVEAVFALRLACHCHVLLFRWPVIAEPKHYHWRSIYFLSACHWPNFAADSPNVSTCVVNLFWRHLVAEKACFAPIDSLHTVNKLSLAFESVRFY